MPSPWIIRRFCSFSTLARSLNAALYFPFRYRISVIAPSMGDRLTCTSRIDRKMLTRVASPSLLYPNDSTIGRRHNDTGTGGNPTVGIAKKEGDESCEPDEHPCRHHPFEPEGNSSGCYQRHEEVNCVLYHGGFTIRSSYKHMESAQLNRFPEEDLPRPLCA